MCRRPGVDFRYTKNKSIRLIHAMKAMLVGIWMVLDMLEKHLTIKKDSRVAQRTKQCLDTTGKQINAACYQVLLLRPSI